ncbi:unnamed protein product [Soboliphyme baturini]|uniref:Tudor domain-containing protein n=1 Tax=Soboliphyme baturini TaxID=241478 RepID=A0A183J7G3_9BILA|nr:unnamed protein product [Soboliphyme baturini]
MSYFDFSANVGERLDGYVCFSEGPREFWFRPKKFEEFLNDLDNILQLYYENGGRGSLFPSLSDCQLLKVGIPCAAKLSVNDRWCRARVANQMGVVQFVDIGHKQLCLLESIKPLARQFSEFMSPAAVHCKVVNFQQLSTAGYPKLFDPVAIIIRSKVEPYRVTVESLISPPTSICRRLLNRQVKS